jgi:hypothetical protein
VNPKKKEKRTMAATENKAQARRTVCVNSSDEKRTALLGNAVRETHRPRVGGSTTKRTVAEQLNVKSHLIPPTSFRTLREELVKFPSNAEKNPPLEFKQSFRNRLRVRWLHVALYVQNCLANKKKPIKNCGKFMTREQRLSNNPFPNANVKISNFNLTRRNDRLEN